MVRMIALIRVNNLADFNHYREQVPATLEPYGGEIRFRAEKPMTLDDENGLGDFSQIALFLVPNGDSNDTGMSQTHMTIYWSLDRVLAPLPLSALMLT